jgi:hypothetical protein
VTWGQSRKFNDVPAQLDAQILLKDLIGNGSGQLFPDDRLHCIFMGNDDGAVLLKHLTALDMIEVAVTVNDILDRFIKAPLQLIAQPIRKILSAPISV